MRRYSDSSLRGWRVLRPRGYAHEGVWQRTVRELVGARAAAWLLRPTGLTSSNGLSYGLRRGLHSRAATRLESS